MPKYTSFSVSNSIKRKSNSSVFSTKNPIVMGVLNVTEDSFFDGGLYLNEETNYSKMQKNARRRSLNY